MMAEWVYVYISISHLPILIREYAALYQTVELVHLDHMAPYSAHLVLGQKA